MANYGTISIRGVIYRDGKLLVVSNQWVPGYLVLPGGAMDPGESVTASLEREIIEELGVNPKVGQLIAIHQIENDDRFSAPSFIFHITNPEDFKDIKLEKTSHGEDEIDEFKFTESLSKVLPQEIIPLLENIDGSTYRAKTKIILSKEVGAS